MTYSPESVKREVRQEAGFGCCKCGLPIIEYHHVIRDSQKPEDIMLLCPLHHHEATVGAMLEQEQHFHKKNPRNIVKGYVQGRLKVNQRIPAINLGSNQFIGEGCFITVDKEDLLSIEIKDGRLLLTMRLFDRNNLLIADIERNEWISGDPLPWDIESRFQWLRIRRKIRDIQLTIDARKYPIDINAYLWRNNQNFRIDANKILFNGVKKNIGLNNVCFVALRLEADTTRQTFRIIPDPRFAKGHLVTHSNRKKRIRNGLIAWSRLIENE
jgi:hypothetical protein